MKNNPYVGPRPYEHSDRRNFYGRKREARDLSSLIMAERVVLFYAPSGAGKTSLLNAQVIPVLEKEDFYILPISDFYDTRSAKRALPFLLSAGFAGAIVSGLSIQFLALQYIPLAWVMRLIAMIGFVHRIRRQLPEEVQRIRQASRDRQGDHESGWENLRDGFRFVRASGILRWLALSTLALVILIKLLTFQASQIFEEQFRGNPEAFKDFNGATRFARITSTVAAE